MTKVTAALLVKKGLILIAKRKASDKLADKWEFPGGKIEAGETPEECLRREMQEEFQIKVNVGDYFCDSVYHYDHGSIQLLAYWVHWKGGELVPMAHDEFQWVPFSELGNFDFAPADLPIVKKLKEKYGGFGLKI